jgi:hypothetical protein
VRNQDTCGSSSGQCRQRVLNTTSCTGASQGDLCDDDAADHCTAQRRAWTCTRRAAPRAGRPRGSATWPRRAPAARARARPTGSPRFR